MKVVVKGSDDKTEKLYVNPNIEFLVKEKKNYNRESGISFLPVRVNDDYYNVIYYDGGQDLAIDVSISLDCWNLNFKKVENENLYVWTTLTNGEKINI